MSYDYCEIYVDTADRDALVNALLDDLGLTRDQSQVAPVLIGHGMDVEVRRNAEDKYVDGNNVAEFLRYPIRIEIAPESGNEDRSIVTFVQRMMGLLRKQSLPATVSCDFESDL